MPLLRVYFVVPPTTASLSDRYPHRLIAVALAAAAAEGCPLIRFRVFWSSRVCGKILRCLFNSSISSFVHTHTRLSHCVLFLSFFKKLLVFVYFSFFMWFICKWIRHWTREHTLIVDRIHENYNKSLRGRERRWIYIYQILVWSIGLYNNVSLCTGTHFSTHLLRGNFTPCFSFKIDFF